MGTIKQVLRRKTRVWKHKTYKDSSGKIHCSECGAFISGRGKKKKK